MLHERLPQRRSELARRGEVDVPDDPDDRCAGQRANHDLGYFVLVYEWDDPHDHSSPRFRNSAGFHLSPRGLRYSPDHMTVT
ncbi:hypothetical protein Q0Z83_036470 [Actinoplanes sichuanensis]|nr:hypothetical protein Q0Z83_036470 [Actinoplanes sichuanensis]